MFAVTRDGARVAYEGAHYKRPAPQAEDYVTLAPGESRSWTVDLSDVYDLSKSGTYALRFDVASPSGQLRSNTLSLSIEGRPNSRTLAAKTVTPQITSSVSYLKCDTTQQGQLAQAVTAASNYANGAVSYLGGTPSATARYTTWFGTYSSAGWNTAKSHYTAIKERLRHQVAHARLRLHGQLLRLRLPERSRTRSTCAAPSGARRRRARTPRPARWSTRRATSTWWRARMTGPTASRACQEPGDLQSDPGPWTTRTATSTSPRTTPLSSSGLSGDGPELTPRYAWRVVSLRYSWSGFTLELRAPQRLERAHRHARLPAPSCSTARRASAPRGGWRSCPRSPACRRWC